MPGALEARAASQPAAPSTVRTAGSAAGPALLGAAAVVLGGALLRGGGSQPGPLVWIGSAAVLAASAGAAAVLAGVLPRPALGRAGAAFAALLAAFAAWAGVTVVWSIGPDRSWESFNRAAAYLAVLALGVLLATALRRAPQAAAALLAGLFALTLVWALATAVVPAVGPDVERSARLRGPAEYWNALALVAAMALPLWLWLGARRRALGAVAVFGTVVALALTTSRGGILAALVALAASLLLTRQRREVAWLLLVSLPPAVAVAGWALTTAVARTGTEGDTRAGVLLGVALAAGAAVVALAARRPPPAWAPRAVAAVALAGLAVAVVFVAPRLGDAWEQFRNPTTVHVTNDPSRLTELSSNHRWTWWTQSWAIFRDHPVGGAGAGTFELARRPIRQDAAGVIDPHNLVLRALGETGAVGFLLLVGAAAAGAVAVVRTLRRRTGEERAAAVALTAGVAAWVAHSLLDMPWEYAAVTAPALFALGVLVAGRPPAGAGAGSGRLLAAVPLVVGLALVASLAFPWLAERRLEASLDALERGRPEPALAAARNARGLNPLSVAPLHLEGTALEFLDREAEARAAYLRAVRLQPSNPEAWYELGRFEYERGRPLRAAAYLEEAQRLDPLAPSTGPLLEQVRAELARRESA